MEVQNIGDDNGTQDATESIQLSSLSAVLNGLEAGARNMRQEAYKVMLAVRSGTYKINPAQLSKRIVNEYLERA